MALRSVLRVGPRIVEPTSLCCVSGGLRLFLRRLAGWQAVSLLSSFCDCWAAEGQAAPGWGLGGSEDAEERDQACLWGLG